MAGAENRAELWIEEYQLSFDVEKESKIFAVCITCKKVIYSAPEINFSTRQIAALSGAGHATSYTPNHELVTIEESMKPS